MTDGRVIVSQRNREAELLEIVARVANLMDDLGQSPESQALKPWDTHCSFCEGRHGNGGHKLDCVLMLARAASWGFDYPGVDQ